MQTNLKLTQNGRSMVEMLGVLAIIGVLSVAGVQGYTTAMNKHRANEILNEASKRAIVVASQIASGRTPTLTEFPDNEVGGATFDSQVKNARGGDWSASDSQFRIGFTKEPSEAVKKQMENIAGTNGMIQGFEGGLTYNNDLSSGVEGKNTNMDYTDPDNPVCKEGFYGPDCVNTCSGEHKVIVNDECVCDEGYEEDENGCKIACSLNNLERCDETSCKSLSGAKWCTKGEYANSCQVSCCPMGTEEGLDGETCCVQGLIGFEAGTTDGYQANPACCGHSNHFVPAEETYYQQDSFCCNQNREYFYFYNGMSYTSYNAESCGCSGTGYFTSYYDPNNGGQLMGCCVTENGKSDGKATGYFEYYDYSNGSLTNKILYTACYNGLSEYGIFSGRNPWSGDQVVDDVACFTDGMNPTGYGISAGSEGFYPDYCGCPGGYHRLYLDSNGYTCCNQDRSGWGLDYKGEVAEIVDCTAE